MIHFRLRFLLGLLAGAVWLLSAGCASREPLPQYYTLGVPAASTAAHTSTSGARLFLRRVTLPGYLQPTTIASRRAENQIEYAPAALWAENLREGFTRALADALAQRPGIGAVSAPPLSVPAARDYDLDVEIDRFEGDDHGEVVLDARWQLTRPGESGPSMAKRGRFVQTGWTYGDESAQARLLGVNVQQLAAQIAQAAGR